MRTPTTRSPALDEAVGAEVWLKCENLRRGGHVQVPAARATQSCRSARVTRRCGRRGALLGRPAAALALAASRGIAATLVMPEDVAKVKHEAVVAAPAAASCSVNRPCTPALRPWPRCLPRPVRSRSIHTTIHGSSPARAQALRVTGRRACVRPGDRARQRRGTVQRDHACGEGSPLRHRGLGRGARQRGRRVPFARGRFRQTENNTTSIADGLLAVLSERTFGIFRDNVGQIVVVDEDEILEAMLFVFDRVKIVIEPSAAVAVAALLRRQAAANRVDPERRQRRSPVVHRVIAKRPTWCSRCSTKPMPSAGFWSACPMASDRSSSTTDRRTARPRSRVAGSNGCRRIATGFGAACYAGLRRHGRHRRVHGLRRLAGSEAVAGGGRTDRDGQTDLVLGARDPRPGAWPSTPDLANRYLARRGARVASISNSPTSVRCGRLDGPSYWTWALTDRRSGWPLEMVLRAAVAGGGSRRSRCRTSPARALEGHRHRWRHGPSVAINNACCVGSAEGLGGAVDTSLTARRTDHADARCHRLCVDEAVHVVERVGQLHGASELSESHALRSTCCGRAHRHADERLAPGSAARPTSNRRRAPGPSTASADSRRRPASISADACRCGVSMPINTTGSSGMVEKHVAKAASSRRSRPPGTCGTTSKPGGSHAPGVPSRATTRRRAGVSRTTSSVSANEASAIVAASGRGARGCEPGLRETGSRFLGDHAELHGGPYERSGSFANCCMPAANGHLSAEAELVCGALGACGDVADVAGRAPPTTRGASRRRAVRSRRRAPSPCRAPCGVRPSPR